MPVVPHLDIRTEPPGILEHLFKIRFIRIAVAISALPAILAFSLLPSEHLHASDAGTSFVHRHVIEHESEHGSASVGHEDHESATTLYSAFDFERRYHPVHPLTTPELLLRKPQCTQEDAVERMDPPPTHGPPIRIRSLRAPPA